MNFDLLTLLTFLPLIGGIVVFFMPRNQTQLVRTVALGFSLAVLALSIYTFYLYAGGACPSATSSVSVASVDQTQPTTLSG